MTFPWQRRNVPAELQARVPPGQVLTEKFPVLHFGHVPAYGDLSGWDVRVWGAVAEPFSLRWADLRNLPVAERTLDIHCVTRWSKLDTRWEGVAFSHIAEVAQPTAGAQFVMGWSSAKRMSRASGSGTGTTTTRTRGRSSATRADAPPRPSPLPER